MCDLVDEDYYVRDDHFSLRSTVHVHEPDGGTLEDLIDGWFTEEPEFLSDLGDAAAFGKSDRDEQIVAVFETGGPAVVIVSMHAPEATLDQLRPRMDEVLRAIEEELS